jgi:hypothetical protein
MKNLGKCIYCNEDNTEDASIDAGRVGYVHSECLEKDEKERELKDSKKYSRMTFVKDNDCHWYLIYLKDKEIFQKWVEYCEGGSESYDGPDFEKYRAEHPSFYSFLDCQSIDN